MSDMWGKSPVKSLTGEEYYVSFIDVTTRFSLITFLKRKSDILTAFKDYHMFIETQTGNKIKRLRSDNGGEYVNEEFKTYCKEHGIHVEYTAPHSPHQNGIAERFNRVTVEGARTLLIQKDLPKSLWAEAIRHVTYLKNRTPHSDRNHAIQN